MTTQITGHITVETLMRAGIFNARILLNGVEQRFVVEAHTFDGWLVRAKTDNEGEPVIEHGELVREFIHGKVTAELG